jgi:hypothetical protein
MSNNAALEALSAFRAREKFRCEEPQFTTLNPSPSSVTRPWEDTLNRCASDLLSLVQAGSSAAKLQLCIAASIGSVKKPFDTEDREYLAYYYNQLGQCVGVRVGPLLNRWLYGPVLATLLRLFSRD